MIAAPLLGVLFALGAVASAAVLYLRRGTLEGTIATGTVIAFTLLAAIAFLI